MEAIQELIERHLAIQGESKSSNWWSPTIWKFKEVRVCWNPLEGNLSLHKKIKSGYMKINEYD